MTIQDGCVLDIAAMCDPWAKSRVTLTVWVTVMVSIVLEVAYQSRKTIAQGGISIENARDNAAMMASRHPTFAPPEVDGDPD